MPPNPASGTGLFSPVSTCAQLTIGRGRFSQSYCSDVGVSSILLLLELVMNCDEINLSSKNTATRLHKPTLDLIDEEVVEPLRILTGELESPITMCKN